MKMFLSIMMMLIGIFFLFAGFSSLSISNFRLDSTSIGTTNIGAFFFLLGCFGVGLGGIIIFISILCIKAFNKRKDHDQTNKTS